MTVADTCFVSANQAKVLLGETAIDDDMGVSLAQVLETAGLEGDNFTLTANDGYAVEVAKDAIKDGVVYVNNDGTNTVKFNGDYPKNTKVKNLLSITASKGEDQAAEANVEETPMAEWAIEFDGLSDGSFTLTSEKAARKLTLVSLHTARTKNDTVKENDWEGYTLLEALTFLHVEEFSQLTITACDGYEVVLMADQVDDETILAVVQDGEPMTDADNMVQLVQNTEFSTTWVKGVAKITVQ
jgi:hypothetical protein